MDLLAALLPLASEKSLSDEGRDIILSMLVVGLIFLGIILIGQAGRWLSHKRKERPKQRRAT